jgi:hypothetical protein
LCAPYDVDAESLSLNCLFCGVDVSDPGEAARGVLVNAITELMESIGRFSPWYTKPASEFGLAILPHRSGHFLGWGLTDGAEERYRGLLDELATAIRTEGALVEAIQHLADLTDATEEWATAICACNPPQMITVRLPRLIESGTVLCGTCLQPFNVS